MWDQSNTPFLTNWHAYHTSETFHGFAYETILCAWFGKIHTPNQPTLLRHSIVQTLLAGAGIFNPLIIAYSNWPRLRLSTNPEWMNRSHGNLRFSANRNFTCFFVTYTNMLTSLITSLVFTVRLVSIKERSSTPTHK